MAPITVVVKKKAAYNGTDYKSLGWKDIGDVIVINDGAYFEDLKKVGFVEEYLDITKELDSENLDADKVRAQRFDLDKMHIAKLRSMAAVLGHPDALRQPKPNLVAFIKKEQEKDPDKVEELANSGQ